MTGSDGSRDDLLDGLLNAAGQPSGNDRLRGVVFAKSIGVIRFRRRLKKCVLAASLVGCYLAGIVTTEIWRPSGDGRPQPSTPQVATNQGPSPHQVPLPTVGLAGSAGRKAAPEPISFNEVLCRSADRHLMENGDVKLAVRNYEHLLKLASAEERAISPTQDNWLLMALKDARSKEMKHDRIEQD